MKKPAKSSRPQHFGCLITRGLVPCQRGGVRLAVCMHTVSHSELTGAHAGIPILTKVNRGSVHACEAHEAPPLAPGRDYCHLLPPSPRRDTLCAAQQGSQPPWGISSPACPIQGIRGRASATLPWPVPHVRAAAHRHCGQSRTAPV